MDLVVKDGCMNFSSYSYGEETSVVQKIKRSGFFPFSCERKMLAKNALSRKFQDRAKLIFKCRGDGCGVHLKE